MPVYWNPKASSSRLCAVSRSNLENTRSTRERERESTTASRLLLLSSSSSSPPLLAEEGESPS